MSNLVRIVAHVPAEKDAAIDRLVAASSIRLSKSVVIDSLLEESPRLKEEMAKKKAKPNA